MLLECSNYSATIKGIVKNQNIGETLTYEDIKLLKTAKRKGKYRLMVRRGR